MNTNFFNDPTKGEDRDGFDSAVPSDKEESKTQAYSAESKDSQEARLLEHAISGVGKINDDPDESEDFKEALGGLLKQLVKQLDENAGNPNGNRVIFKDGTLEPKAIVVNGKEWPLDYDIQGEAEDKLDKLADAIMDHCKRHCLPMMLVVQKGMFDGKAARMASSVNAPGPRCASPFHFAMRIANAILENGEYLSPSFMMDIYGRILGEIKRRKGGSHE